MSSRHAKSIFLSGNRIWASKMSGHFIWKYIPDLRLWESISGCFGYEYSKIGIYINRVFSISKQNFDKFSWKLWFMKNVRIFLKKDQGTRFSTFCIFIFIIYLVFKYGLQRRKGHLSHLKWTQAVHKVYMSTHGLDKSIWKWTLIISSISQLDLHKTQSLCMKLLSQFIEYWTLVFFNKNPHYH